MLGVTTTHDPGIQLAATQCTLGMINATPRETMPTSLHHPGLLLTRVVGRGVQALGLTAEACETSKTTRPAGAMRSKDHLRHCLLGMVIAKVGVAMAIGQRLAGVKARFPPPRLVGGVARAA